MTMEELKDLLMLEAKEDVMGATGALQDATRKLEEKVNRDEYPGIRVVFLALETATRATMVAQREIDEFNQMLKLTSKD